MSDLTNIYCQRNSRYKNEPLGKGVGGSTIYDYGCYFMAFSKGLQEDPLLINQLLLDYGLWTNGNHIDVSQITTKLQDIFKLFKSQTNFTMDQYESWCSDENIILVCQVDARGIGGSGTHFVKGEKRDEANAIIFDPWYGDTIKVADRYKSYGNIKSVRIFYLQDNWKVKLKQLLNISEGNMSETITVEKKDWERARKSMDIVEAIHTELDLDGDHIEIGKDPYVSKIKIMDAQITEQEKQIKSLNTKLESCNNIATDTPEYIQIGNTKMKINGLQINGANYAIDR